MIQEVTDSGLLTDPLRVWRVLNESSKAIATGRALADSDGLIALATSVSGLRPKDISFVTLPWLPSGDGATIVTDQTKADAIWAALAAEQPWPPPPTKGADGEKLTVVPGDIRVNVHNATGVEGQGSRAAEDLAVQGFVLGTIDAREKVAAATTIRHSPTSSRRPELCRPQSPDRCCVRMPIRASASISRSARATTGSMRFGSRRRGRGRGSAGTSRARPPPRTSAPAEPTATERRIGRQADGHPPADIVSCDPTPAGGPRGQDRHQRRRGRRRHPRRARLAVGGFGLCGIRVR